MVFFPECFYSNQLENLFEQLKTRLFSSSHPLTRRLVIVPGPMMRTWLQHRLATDPIIGVAAGIEMGFVEPTLGKLCSLFSSGAESRKFEEPTAVAIAFALEKEMASVIELYGGFSVEEKKLWKPMLDYLQVEKGNLQSLRLLKRMHALAVQLGDLFLEYGRVGGAVTSLWNESSVQGLGWQECLWVKIEKLFAPWGYSSRKFSEFKVEKVPFFGDLQVHLFGLSYLSSLHHQFLTKLTSHVPLSYYCLSPCQKFWSDTVSDKEAKRIAFYWQQKGISISQQEQLEAYLRSNPLLANFGKLGREMAMQIEASEFQVTTDYVVSKSALGHEVYERLVDEELSYQEKKKLTLLHAVQADLVLLRNPAEGMPVEFDSYDQTIQIHEASKPLREVQIIYDRLLAIIEEHNKREEPILPEDIIVMAPDISKYSPYIKSIFGSEESVLNCQIMDLKVPAHNAFVQAFLLLLRLPFGRWDKVSLFKLFESHAFQKRHQFLKEDVKLFNEWFRKAGICWGKDENHRNELLRRDHCFRDMVEDSWAGTWEHGLGKLLEGLATLPDEGISEVLSFESIQSTQSNLLGRLLYVLGSLMEDLKPLGDRTKMTLKQWSEYLKCLLDAYFKKSSSGEDAEGYGLLIKQFDDLALAGRKLTDVEFEFHCIYDVLERALQQQLATHRESYLHAVRFCSLQPMRAIPSKVVVLLGMQEGQFPRSSVQNSLNLVQGNPEADYYPSSTEFDRYLFLETLLSAREYLLMSYSSSVSGDSGQALASPLVSELINYLGKTYVICEKSPEFSCCFRHPMLPFDERYFSEDKRLFSYSQLYYQAACAYYNGDKQQPHCFIENFSCDSEKAMVQEGFCITIKELDAFAKNPMKVYFNKALGIYLDKESVRISKTEEDLHLSYLDIAILSRKGLMLGAESLLHEAEQAGRLPRGPFKAVGKNIVLEKVENLASQLGIHGVEVEGIFSVECSDKYRQMEFFDNRWRLPSLKLEVEDIGEVSVVGILETVSKEGLICFSKDGLESAVKAWPSLLVLCCLIKKYPLEIKPSVLFAETAKPARLVDFDDPERLLSDYLKYYLKGLTTPSPLFPDWVPLILEKDEERLRKLYNVDSGDAFRFASDEYLEWMKSNSGHMDLSSVVDHWSATAQNLFVDLRSAWYPKKAGVGGKEVDHDCV